MARNFVQSSIQHINFPNTTEALLGTVFTVACRLRPTLQNDSFQSMFAQSSTTIANSTLFQLGVANNSVGPRDTLRFLLIDDAITVMDLFSSSVPSINEWHSAVGTRNVNDYEFFVDGVSQSTITVTLGTIVASLDMKVGARVSGSTTPIHGFGGDVADCAIWTVVLTNAEIAAYNKGVSPNLIRPDKLLRYFPLWGTTQEPELTGTGGKGTLVNSPLVSTTVPPVSQYIRRTNRFVQLISPLFPYVPPVDPSVDFDLKTVYTPPTDPNVDFNLADVVVAGKLQIGELLNKYQVVPVKFGLSELHNEYRVAKAIPKLSELSNKYSVAKAFLRLGELNNRYSVEVVSLKLSELANKYDVNPAILALAELQNKYAVGVAKLRQSELQSKYSVQDQKLEAQLLALYAFRFGKQFEAKFGVTVARQFLSQAFYSLSTQLAAEYSINTTAKKQLDSLYDITNTDFIEAQFDSVYAIARITTQFGAPYSIGPVIKRQLNAPYILATVPVAKQFDSIFDITNTNPVVKQFKGVFAILTTQIINITGQPTVTLNGEVLEIATADVSIDEGSFIWRATIGILDIEDYVKFAINDDIVLDLYGETFNLVVESKHLSRSGPAQINMNLIAVSPAIKFDFPRASALEISFTSPILAEAAAEQVLGGENIDWQITDWLIPANRLAIKDGAPIRLVQDIVEAAGGVLESKPDGQLVARPLFPVSLPDFSTASLDQTYTDSSDNLSVSEQFSPTKRLNKFRLLDVSSSNRDNMEFEFDDIVDANGDTTKSKTEGVLRIFPSPFRTNLVLRSSRGGEVGFQLIGTATEQREQQVEFKEGFSSLSEAIESIDSVVWEGISLGAISFAQGDTKISSASVVNLYGLATIKYTTKFLKYKVSGIESIDVQFRTEVT